MSPPRGRPTTPEARAAARALATRLRALEEGALRDRAAARELAELPAALAAEVVAALVDLAAEGDPLSIVAVGRALGAAHVPYHHRAALYAAAVAQGLGEVSALLLCPGPRREWREPRDPADPRLAAFTLGHKKALARTLRDPDLLARLAAEGDPVVVQELLRNPLLTEEFAVRLAARRPCRPETLRCLHLDRRWRVRPRVAGALARNPFVEPAIALRILPALGEPSLGEIAADGALHPLVRATAARLRELRAGDEAARPS